MAKDVLAGAVFFAFFATMAFLLASALPLWWYSTTELEGRMCACGTGLWQANVTWGDDLLEPGLLHPVQCDSSEGFIVDGCDAKGSKAQAETRRKGDVAGIFSILATLLSLGAIGFSMRVIEEKNDMRRLRWGVVCAACCSGIAILAETITLAVFMSSPLFDNLSYNFSCHFQFLHSLNSNPLKCHALGPSFGLAVGGIILSSFACALFGVTFKRPHYLDPNTGRYSMFQVTKSGARPLDPVETPAEDNSSPASTSMELRDEAEEEESLLQQNGVKRRRCGRGLGVAKSFLDFAKLYHVPTLLIFNVALFTWSNCSTGATVEPNVRIQFPKGLHWIGHELFPNQIDKHGTVAFKDDVFNFTILTSLRHFWEGHAYGLAILIGGFSGIWPYVKLFTMMVLWFVPAREKLRGKMLHWLDVLGKWSLIDAYVLCLMAVAFGFNADKNIAGIQIHVDMSVRPGWGVMSFIIATIWSLIMSHYMSFLHRRTMESREFSDLLLKGMERPPHETLATRAYAPYPRRRRFACSRSGQIVVWFVLFVTFGITLTGQLIRTFEFRFSGLADLILDEESRNTTYSLVSNGLLLPQACSKGGFLSGGNWAWFVTISYFAFAMVIPLVMLIALAILWGIPMTLSNTKRTFHLCQVLQAWSALDVFIVSIIAAVLEIGGLSEAILANSFAGPQETLCKSLKRIPTWLLDRILETLGLSSVQPELEHCALFRVDAGLLEGTWMLLYAIAAWGISTHFIMELADASIQERTCILQALASVNEESDFDDAAQHAASRDPYLLLRTQIIDDGAGMVHESETEAQGAESQTLQSTRSVVQDNNVNSIYLRRILQAQEEGAARFMGTYFGDCMYGAFPRVWWRWLERIGIMHKVHWDRVGFDIHSALLMNMFAEREGQRNLITVDSEPWAPTSPFLSSETSPS